MITGLQEWQPFPKRWYNEGLLITNSVVKDQENVRSHGLNQWSCFESEKEEFKHVEEDSKKYLIHFQIMVQDL